MPKKRADAILVSDIHLTDSTPVSRTDDYLAAQIKTLQSLDLLAREHRCPVLCAGDVFDRWKASPYLCGVAFAYLPRPFICIPGQHDLPGHSLPAYPNSALALIEGVASDVTVLLHDSIKHESLSITGFAYGSNLADIKRPEDKTIKRHILMLHTLTWHKSRPSWDKAGVTDKELLKMFGSRFDLILTGDNHKPFVSSHGKTLLVNPGSAMQMTADQIDHQPRCYLYYADAHEVEQVNLPKTTAGINRNHLKQAKDHADRSAAYIAYLQEGWDSGLSFERNLESYFAETNTPRKVREIAWEHLKT